MNLTHYAIDEKNRLVYLPNPERMSHIVWGVGAYGFFHGVGSYIRRGEIGEGFVFNRPDSEDIDKYYDNLSKFLRDDE